MTPFKVPTKTVFGAMLLGAATLGVAKLLGKSQGASARSPLQPSSEPEPRTPAASPLPASGSAKGGKAPFADGLAAHKNEAPQVVVGTAAPVEAAKHGGIGQPFSAAVVGDVEPSASNKGGLADGGR